MTQLAQTLFLETIEEWLQVCEDALHFLETGDLPTAEQKLRRARELGYLSTWFADITAFYC